MPFFGGKPPICRFVGGFLPLGGLLAKDEAFGFYETLNPEP